MDLRPYRLLFLLSPFPAAAETPSPALISGSAVRTDLGAQMVQVLGGLGMVLAMVLLLAWLAKRFAHSRMTGTQGLRLLGGLSLGAKERIVLVQVGDTQLLVGVAPGRLQTLHVLEEPIPSRESSAEEVSASSGFGRKLSQLLDEKKGKNE
ncbi:flagellar biosynthetic protein FliO [Thiolapillus sp.]